MIDIQLITMEIVGLVKFPMSNLQE